MGAWCTGTWGWPNCSQRPSESFTSENRAGLAPPTALCCRSSLSTGQSQHPTATSGLYTVTVGRIPCHWPGGKPAVTPLKPMESELCKGEENQALHFKS